ncbi:hypothetical protein DEMA109039_14875 [Deinococcus marmoris]
MWFQARHSHDLHAGLLNGGSFSFSHSTLRYNRATPKAKNIRQRETPRGSLQARIPQRVSETRIFPVSSGRPSPMSMIRLMEHSGQWTGRVALSPRSGAWRSKRRWKIRTPQKSRRQGKTFSPASCRNSGTGDAAAAHLMACLRTSRTHPHCPPLNPPPRLACFSVTSAPRDRRRVMPRRCSSTLAASSAPAHPPNPGRRATGNRHRRPRPPGSRRPPQTAR